jgi:S1-C subfamily serine protease
MLEWPGNTAHKWPTHRSRRALVIEVLTVLLVVIAAITITRAASAGSGTPNSPTVPAAVTTRVEPGVVDVVSTLGLQSAQAAGTGMVMAATGEVLTNNHVVNGATSVQVTDVGNDRSYSAVVVGTDAANDVAVLQLDGASRLATVPFGDSTSVFVGNTVVAIGNAGGVGGKPSTAPGSITALGQSITATDAGGLSEQLSNMIETDAAIQPGDSGGPLVSGGGQVIGMDTAASNGYTMQVGGEEGFAIPINTARSIAAQIEAGKASSTVHIGPAAFIGVSVQETSGGPGAEVAGVFEGSPAQKAGLGTGDVITTLNGQTVTSASDLSDALRAFHPGDTIELGWVGSSGQQRTTVIHLAVGPAD